MAQILKGLDAAKSICSGFAEDILTLKAHGITPTLQIIRVGERADDISYEKGACKRAQSVGIDVKTTVLDVDCNQDELINVISHASADNTVHGILLFRPFPKHINERLVKAALVPGKDVDGITDLSLAGVFCGSNLGFPPCTAEACVELLKRYDIDLCGKKAVVIGRSLVIGKPVSMMLLNENMTVTICHTKTIGLREICKDADIIVVATGKRNALTAEFVRAGQVIVDVGIHVDESGKLCGDVDFSAVEPIISAISPVPGGVGSVTTSILMSHVVQSAIKSIR